MSDPSKDARERARLLAGELREGQRGQLPESVDGNLAAIVDDHDSRALLGFAEQVWERRRDPNEDPEFAETQWAQDRLTLEGNDAGHDAVESGNVSKMSNIVGWPEYENNASSLHTAAQLEEWLCESEKCKLVYIAALMGRGKTDLALSFLALIGHYYRRARDSLQHMGSVDAAEVPQPEFAANFEVHTPQGEPDVLQISDFDRLEEWAQRGDSSQVRWFIFDEASTELTAQSGSNAQDVAEVMAPFVKKMRKNGINMIVIGHDAGDIHPAIRSLADYVDKRGLKTASFYAGVNSREGVGHLFDAQGLPPVEEAGWSFNTDDLAEWSWGSALEDGADGGLSPEQMKREVAERAAMIWQATPDEVTQSDVARAVSYGDISVSRTTISRAKDRVQT